MRTEQFGRDDETVGSAQLAESCSSLIQQHGHLTAQRQERQKSRGPLSRRVSQNHSTEKPTTPAVSVRINHPRAPTLLVR